jgi:N-acetyl-anhydromuramyl-L-alanine amidase AmpD
MMTERGWMPDTTKIPAKDFGYRDVEPGTMKPIGVINHVAQGYISTIDAWARDADANDAMPHFGITRDGEIHQYVDIFSRAYHSGRHRNEPPPTWELLPRKGAGWVNPNYVTVGVEHEGFSAVPSYGFDYVYDSIVKPWPEAMIEASIKVHAWMFEAVNKDREQGAGSGSCAPLEPSTLTIIGHNETSPGSRAHDPGEAWPQQRIIDGTKLATVEPVVTVPSVAIPVGDEIVTGLSNELKAVQNRLERIETNLREAGGGF